MAARDRSHILIPGLAEAEAYRPPPRAIPSRPRTPPANRRRHGEQLASELQGAEQEGLSRRSDEDVSIGGAVDGVYVRFEAFEGLEDVLESLDPRGRGHHPELRAFRQVTVDAQPVEQAVVFIPDGQLGYFLRRIDRYLATTDRDNPRSARLLDRIQSIGLASLEQLWTDPAATFPPDDDPVWWEVWLRRRDGEEVARLRQFGEASGVEVGVDALGFADRLVVLVRATAGQLGRALDVLDDVAELRRPREPAGLIALEQAADQSEWVAQLASRTRAAKAGAPAACVVDTGVHQAHPMLSSSLDAVDCHTCDPTWGVDDRHGHGTEMAGLALFGDVGAAVLSGAPVRLRHRLESVKLLPRPNVNPPHLWGAFTATATATVEVQAPDRRRVFGMAVSAGRDPVSDVQAERIMLGQPSSWSAAVDALAAGLAIAVTDDGMVYLDEGGDRTRRLFLLAAGNVDFFDDAYLDRSDVEPIEDPGQAWNALTVGAFTEADTIDPGETGYSGWTTLAPRGELSPHSRTSVAFHRQWPVKPEVVFEGGNIARSPDATTFDTPYSLQSLTTKAPIGDARLLTVTCATSAATARAAHLAASILAEYPGLRTETVRGLIVHSAEWTEPMRARLNAAATRRARVALFRRYGMGVPDLTRATRSATDALTLVAEDIIHPFDGQGRMREMNLHQLPWPTDVLGDLGDADVRMRVTLSYFVDPNPARRGWQRRYRYASHGLRFEVRRPTESSDDFRKRINQLALAEEERRPSVQSDANEWFFGPNERVAGSLHTDIWTGTAADLAQRGAIAVYPVTGWWKERPTATEVTTALLTASSSPSRLPTRTSTSGHRLPQRSVFPSLWRRSKPAAPPGRDRSSTRGRPRRSATAGGHDVEYATDDMRELSATSRVVRAWLHATRAGFPNLRSWRGQLSPKVRPSAETPGVRTSGARREGPDFLAEDRGFEPLRDLSQHDFQSCALGH